MMSLRARLRAVLGLTLAFCWICGVGVVAMYTASSENTQWDSKLQAFGTRLLLSIPADEIYEGPFGPGLELPPGVQQEPENFAFQVWTGRHSLFIKTPAAPDKPFQPSFRDGFASNVVAGEKWRIYTISDRNSRVSVQVANLQSVIDREMQHEALIALSLLTAVLLLVAALLGRVLDRSLRPLRVIEDAVLRRHDLDLTPLPLADLPMELLPLITSFNHLLVQLDKAVEAERRFLGDAAHELRTPLAAIQAQADVAIHAATDREKNEALHMLQQAARRGARLAEQLLDMARLDAMSVNTRAAPLDLSQLASHVVQEYAYLANRRGCMLAINASSVHIAGDIDELAIMLRNLVDNAVRFASNGGRVLVTCGTTSTCQYLAVADDGPGVPEHEHSAIFQRFYRIPGHSGRGSGIGLSLVAAIARLHGARIVTGTGLAGRGFSVRIEFPSPSVPDAPSLSDLQKAYG